MNWQEWWVSCNPIGVDEPLAFGERNSFRNERTDRHILMQYTGLCDTNGQEIYEGDICADGKIVVEIVWSDHHQWGCKVIKGGVLSKGLIFPLWHWDKCKMNGYRELDVIGNIYENPELLA